MTLDFWVYASELSLYIALILAGLIVTVTIFSLKCPAFGACHF